MTKTGFEFRISVIVICLLFDICDLEFFITLRAIKITLTRKLALGIVSANHVHGQDRRTGRVQSW